MLFRSPEGVAVSSWASAGAPASRWAPTKLEGRRGTRERVGRAAAAVHLFPPITTLQSHPPNPTAPPPPASPARAAARADDAAAPRRGGGIGARSDARQGRGTRRCAARQEVWFERGGGQSDRGAPARARPLLLPAPRPRPASAAAPPSSMRVSRPMRPAAPAAPTRARAPTRLLRRARVRGGGGRVGAKDFLRPRGRAAAALEPPAASGAPG